MKNFLFLLIAGLTLFSCQDSISEKSDLIRFIPRKSSVIIKTNDWKDFTNSILDNEIVKSLSKTGLFKSLHSQINHFKNLNPSETVYLSFVPLGKNEYDIVLVTRDEKNLFALDSSTQKNIKQIDYNGTSIGHLKRESDLYFTTVNNIFLASTSQLLLENAIREENSGTDHTDQEFLKVSKTVSRGASAYLFIKGDEAGKLFSDIFNKGSSALFKNNFKWGALDLDLESTKIQINGILTYDHSAKNTLSILENTGPASTKISEITPIEARGAKSFAYKSWEAYLKNLINYRQVSPKEFSLKLNELFSNAGEVGCIYIENSQVIALRPLDMEMARETLRGQQEELETYRDIPIKKLNDSVAFKTAFKEVFDLPTVNAYCELGDFLIFGQNPSVLKNVIANFQNKTVLSERENFQDISKKLSNESSLYFIGSVSKMKVYLAGLTNEEESKTIKNIGFEDYPYAVAQVIQDDNFAHFNVLLEKNNIKLESGAVSQLASAQLEADLATAPKLVRNYRTKGMDIVVQDVKNVLYLISNKGKILWKKHLKSKILGPVEQVDLYKNGRLQLAFTTSDSFYILDRNGNEVAPFPIKFEDDVTQPLAVFDYDGNRNYRFVISQGSNLLMYNKDAKIVKGFKFTTAKSNLIFPPKHIRIGTKDYIVITQQNGTLNILDRTGDTRVSVKEKIDFGYNPVYEGENSFLVYDANANKITISQNGKMTSNKSGLSSELKYYRNERSEAILNENELIINNKEQELEFGLYTGLKIETIGKNTYILVTDEQAKRVYVFDSKGNLLPNFPIYGTSAASIGYLERNKNLGLAVQGENNTVIIYRIN